MENTFDINAFDKDRTASPASFRQCQAIGYKFAKKGSKVIRNQKQIQVSHDTALHIDLLQKALTFL